jgi:hypothetical protein
MRGTGYPKEPTIAAASQAGDQRRGCLENAEALAEEELERNFFPDAESSAARAGVNSAAKAVSHGSTFSELPWRRCVQMTEDP